MIYNVLFVLAGFFMDTILSLFFPLDPAMRTIVWVPSLGFLSFILTIRKRSLGEALALGVLIGFIVDALQYQQPVTILVFPLVVFAVKSWSEHLNDSAVETIFIGVVALFLRELGLYLWFLGIGVTRLTPELWFAKRVFLTLIVHIPLLWAWLGVNRLKNTLVAHAEANRRFQETALWRPGQKR
jgi:rod shape-determining protein MreD